MKNNKQTPKVSVIIPVYNEEKYILKTLNAINFQSYSNFEVVVVNNASTDASDEIINHFIQKNSSSIPFLYKIEYKQGTNYARECGRNIASGEIIALLDADCIPSYNWISNGVKKLQKKEVIAATGAYFYYDASWLLRVFSLASQLTIFKIVNNIIQYRKRGAILIGGNAFIKTELLDLIGGFNTNLTFYGDDIDMAVKLSKLGKLSYSYNLTLKTSSRRYKALGFWKVNKKYQNIFKELLKGKGISSQQSLELVHPR